ncbi:MAG: MerR family DNA-binding transcriptional regulator, partial [Gammaproteobacteria bacterium]|nr:MerR family DNA-binding transcriptional regulator [Gammaproteobacteria bacterium]
MKIQQLSELSGVSVKTIRYYEDVNLLPAPQR